VLSIPNAFTFVGELNRPNLFHEVVAKPAGLHEQIRLMAEWIYGHGDQKASGIVHVSYTIDASVVADVLAALPYQLTATTYHGQMEDAWERIRDQKAWLSGEALTMVSTNAFGTGINKQDVRYVIHFSVPGSGEDYYQQTGRACRDQLEGAMLRCAKLVGTRSATGCDAREHRVGDRGPERVFGAWATNVRG
jgi:ATP-dependent DNA helicase RecQ